MADWQSRLHTAQTVEHIVYDTLGCVGDDIRLCLSGTEFVWRIAGPGSAPTFLPSSSDFGKTLTTLTSEASWGWVKLKWPWASDV